jgi:hypothetical protein
MKQANINVANVWYAENREMGGGGKDAISFILKPHNAQKKKAFNRRTLNGLTGPWIHYALLCVKSIYLRTFLLSYRQYQVPIYHQGYILHTIWAKTQTASSESGFEISF